MTEKQQEDIYNGTPQFGLAVLPAVLQSAVHAQQAWFAAGQAAWKAGLAMNPFLAPFVR